MIAYMQISIKHFSVFLCLFLIIIHFMIITENSFFFFLIEKGGNTLNVKYPEYGAGKLISSFMRWTAWWRRMPLLKWGTLKENQA